MAQIILDEFQREFEVLTNTFGSILDKYKHIHPELHDSYKQNELIATTAMALSPERGLRAFIDKTYPIWVVEGPNGPVKGKDELIRRCQNLVLGSESDNLNLDGLDQCWVHIENIVKLCLEYVEIKRNPIWKEKDGKRIKVYQETYVKGLSYSKSKAVWG